MRAVLFGMIVVSALSFAHGASAASTAPEENAPAVAPEQPSDAPLTPPGGAVPPGVEGALILPGDPAVAKGAAGASLPSEIGDQGAMHRASQLVGTVVRNDAKEQIGVIDDLIFNAADKSIYAVVSVGRFVGSGERLIAVPYELLVFDGAGGATLNGATREYVAALPAFKYRES